MTLFGGGPMTPALHVVRVTCLCLGLATAVAQPTDSSWRAGTARVKITPEKLLWMTGFSARTRPAEGTLQDLWTKALALQDPSGERAVMLTADLCAVSREITDRVASQLERSHRIPRRSVLVNVSHTHCAPAIEGTIEGLREFNAQERADLAAYRVTLEKKMVQAAVMALDALRPASLDWGKDSAEFGVNRRENREADLPELRAAGRLRGPVDYDVPVLTVRSADGTLAAIVVSYACHPTALAIYRWTGDYAGFAQDEMERRHPGATALFVQGCGGDIKAFGGNDVARTQDYGSQLADAVDRALARPMRTVQGKFNSALADLELAFARQPTREQLNAAAQDKNDTTRVWARFFLARMDQGKEIKMSHSYPVQVWRLGGLAWVALGGEVVVDYSLRLKALAGEHAWILGYSNDVMAYIPSERIWREDAAYVEDMRLSPGSPRTGFSGYEGYRSMRPHAKPSPWQPGLEDRIVQKAQELLRATDRSTVRDGGRSND